MTQPASAERRADFPQLTPVEERITGRNFSLVRLGKPQDLNRYAIQHPLGQTIRGKVFLKEPLDLTALEISYGLIPPHTSIPFFHRHQQNEEVYLFLSGHGEFQVDGDVFAVSEGTAVRIAPAGVRCCRNTSADNMFYIVIQAKAGSLEQWTGTDGVAVPGEIQWPDPL